MYPNMGLQYQYIPHPCGLFGESVDGIVVIIGMVVVSCRVCIKKDRELHEKLDQENLKYMSFQIFPLWISLFIYGWNQSRN